jgi:hypothetical protein
LPKWVVAMPPLLRVESGLVVVNLCFVSVPPSPFREARHVIKDPCSFTCRNIRNSHNFRDEQPGETRKSTGEHLHPSFFSQLCLASCTVA